MTTLSPEDSALDAWLLYTHGKRLPYVERAIASLPDDDPNKPELQKYLHWAKEAHASGNQFQMTMSAHLLVVSVKAAVRTIPFAMTGEKHKLTQREKASKPRGNVAETIKELAKRKDELGDWLTPKELWPDLFAMLDESFGANEEVTENGEFEIRYANEGGSIRTMKFSSFKSAISRHRAKS